MGFYMKIMTSLINTAVRYNSQNPNFALEVGIVDLTPNIVKFSLTLVSHNTLKKITKMYHIQEQDDIQFTLVLAIHHLHPLFDEQVCVEQYGKILDCAEC